MHGSKPFSISFQADKDDDLGNPPSEKFPEPTDFNGSIDGREFVKIQIEYVLAFFNKHLRNIDTPLLGDSALDNGQVMYKSRQIRDL